MVGPRVLIIDDEPNIVELVKALLEQEGFEVQRTTSGAEGIRIVQMDPPDVVLLDLRMPDPDGWEVCRRIREFSEVPILILSAIDHHEGVQRALQVGADGHMTKPFEPEELVTRLNALAMN